MLKNAQMRGMYICHDVANHVFMFVCLLLFFQALVVELEGMMKAAHEKGLEEMEEVGGREEGEGSREGEGGRRGKEGEGGVKEGGEEEGRKENEDTVSHFRVPISGKRSSRRPVKTPAGGKSGKLKVKARLKAPLVEWNSDDDATGAPEWSDDGDFKSDVLSSARKATIINSGSNQKRKPVRQRKKIRPLVYSSDEGDSAEEGEGEEGEADVDRITHKIPSRFTFSDEDD